MKEVKVYTACLILLLYRERRALVLTGVRKQSLHGTVISAVLHRLVVTQRSARIAAKTVAVASPCTTGRQSEYAESMSTMPDFGIFTLVPTARKK